MDKLPIEIYKNAKKDPMEGPFFIESLSFDELFDFQEKVGKDDLANSRLLQMCIVDSDGERVFKPQQIKIIKDRMSGSHYMASLIAANGVNDFDAISQMSEKYSKNTSSNQNSE